MRLHSMTTALYPYPLTLVLSMFMTKVQRYEGTSEAWTEHLPRSQ